MHVRTSRSRPGGLIGRTSEIGGGSECQDRRDERRLVVARERPAPGGHLVEHGAEREHVRPRVGLFPAELFGRHVRNRADDRALGGQVVGLRHRLARVSSPDTTGATNALREPEVEQLDARLREHHVAGLEIPVHDPFAMGGLERRSDLRTESHRLVDRQRSLRQPVGQRLAFEKLHDEVLGVPLAPHVVQRADMGMGELRHGPRLPLEPQARLRRRRDVRRQHLDRDLARKPRVVRPVDLPHPAGSDRRQDLVGAQLRRRQQDVKSNPSPGADSFSFPPTPWVRSRPRIVSRPKGGRRFAPRERERAQRAEATVTSRSRGSS